MTARRRTSLPDIAHTFQEYLFHRDVLSAETKAKEKAAKALRDYTKSNGTVRVDDDGNEVTGNIEYLLGKPINVGGKIYRGAEMRKQAQISFDEDAAIALVAAKNIPLADVVASVTITLPIVDFQLLDRIVEVERGDDNDWSKDWNANVNFAVNQDAFYVLNQQGKITDDELDSLLVEGEPKYSLWPLEGEE